MSTEKFDSENFLRKFSAAWNGHDLSRIADTFTSDAIFEALFGPDVWGERAEGREEATRLAARVFERIPDVQFNVFRQHVTPELIVLELVQSGTPVNGPAFECHIVDLLSMQEGRVRAKRTYRKALKF